VVEGSQDCVPMIVLTADRPHELRATGANQAIDQVLLLYSYEATTIFYSGGLVSSSSLTMIFSANSLLHHGSEARNVERTGFGPKTRTFQN
jgi:2-succinyl-5-enolpyruvyl-6-hydroxy-3-cyclohexene-1-carboxylate synthase